MNNTKNSLNAIEESLSKLRHYIERERFMGYDPYDVHNSSIPIKRLPHFFQFALSQINKRSPINLRQVLNIKKQPHTKAMGLFLAGYSNLISLYDDAAANEKASIIVDWLINNRSTNYKNFCWGFDYAYSSRNGRVEKRFPTVIHHSYVLNGLINYFHLTNNQKAKKILLKADDFIIENIPFQKYPNGLCFGYHPGAKGCCYNASLHAAESLAIVNSFNKKKEYFDLIKGAVQYVISKQKSSGVWYYSHGEDPDKEKIQIDFHQGFILDSLDEINRHTNYQLDSMIQPAISKGLDYYHSIQFDQKGRCHYRYPQKHPIDIHNQAQGIITFSRFSHVKHEYMLMADKIVDWTIANMQDRSGYFYYQKYKCFKNKISYIRWGQAWMFYALTEYLRIKKHL